MSTTTRQSAIDDDPTAVPTRRFTLLDAMILVAVTALGLAWNESSRKAFLIYNSPFDKNYPTLQFFNRGLWNFLPHLTLWSLTVVAVGLPGPRHLLRHKVRQPGMAACCAASLAIFFQAGWYIPFRIRLHRPDNVLTGALLIQVFEMGAFAVAGAWMVLVAGGLWQSRRDWIDRVGRVLGVSWIVAALYYNFRNLSW